LLYFTYLLNIDALCLSCFFAKYKSFLINVVNNNINNITNNVSVMMNNVKPKLFIFNHHSNGPLPTILWTNCVHSAHNIGNNQLTPMAMRRPFLILASNCTRFGPNSDCTINVIATNVDELNSKTAASVELISPCQSCKLKKTHKKKMWINYKVMLFLFDINFFRYYI
jgi:hypothetical protein